MTVIVLVGDDQVALRSRRAQLAESAAVHPSLVERYDLADPTQHATAAISLRTPSMFGDARYVEIAGAEHLTADLAALLGNAPAGDTVVVWGARVPASVKKDLGAVRTETLNVTSDPTRRLIELADSHRVTLTADALATLTRLVGHDLGRAASVLYSLAVVGITRPTGEQVTRFTSGATPAPGTPWGVADAVAAGDLETALALTEGLEPVAVLGYLSTRLGQLGRIVDSGYGQPEEVASALGVANLAGARRLLEHADRLGARGVADSWVLLATSDVAVKRSPHPQLVLSSTLVKLARLWAAPARPYSDLPAPV